jgi:hypothetical protein
MGSRFVIYSRPYPLQLPNLSYVGEVQEYQSSGLRMAGLQLLDNPDHPFYLWMTSNTPQVEHIRMPSIIDLASTVMGPPNAEDGLDVITAN